MLNREREQEILSILKTTNGFVTVRQLCESLFASESSIRRDLKALETRGLVKRSYGGAVLESNYSNIVTFNHRSRQNISAKREIAQKAAGLIKDGDIVFLDQSSTAFYLAGELIDRSSLTVVTNNIEITMLLANSKIRLISSGGFLSNENRNCLIGGDAQRTFENVFADIMFFSVKAISDDGLVTDCSREEIIVRETMLKNADKKVLLCDSSKFGMRAPFKQCELGDVDYLISEENSAQHFSEYQSKIELL
jgi:DeoR/GlpR family transcriptional regulator of sugar metabolism